MHEHYGGIVPQHLFQLFTPTVYVACFMLNLVFRSDSIMISSISYHQYPLFHVLSNDPNIKLNEHF